MAIYMKLDKLDEIKGSATIKEIGGKKGLIPVASTTWSTSRPIHVTVGASTGAESGQVSVSDVSVTRTADGASPYLETFFFAPTADGKTVDFLITKADREGAGEVPAMIITLEEARLNAYSLNCSPSSITETLTLAYTVFSVTHYTEDEGGKIEKGDTIKFDLKSAKLLSKAKLP